MREPAFEIRPIGDKGEPVGRIIRIYADGSVDGIDGGFIVFNRIPILVKRAECEALARRDNQGKIDTAAERQTPSLSDGKIEAAGAPQKPTGIRSEDTNRKVDRIESFFDEMDTIFTKHFGPMFNTRSFGRGR